MSVLFGIFCIDLQFHLLGFYLFISAGIKTKSRDIKMKTWSTKPGQAGHFAPAEAETRKYATKLVKQLVAIF